MKRLFGLLLMISCLFVLTACGNNPKDMFVGKTYFAEPIDGGDTFLLEFQDDQYVKLMYPQLNNAGEIGTYSISEETYDGMYHVNFNLDELGHDDYLFDKENMMLLGVDEEELKFEEESYYDDYSMKVSEYNN